MNQQAVGLLSPRCLPPGTPRLLESRSRRLVVPALTPLATGWASVLHERHDPAAHGHIGGSGGGLAALFGLSVAVNGDLAHALTPV